MRHRSLPIGIVAIACGLLANATPSRAAAETWVSGTGVNSGSCPITAPCRSFDFAHGQTNPGGTINVLSAGNFGAVTITKSISIVADGVEAAIHGGGAIGAAIKIEAGDGDIVSLRGLTIDLRGSSNDGISFRSGAALHVHNSVIRRSVAGIYFAPTSGTSELYVADSVIADSREFGIFFNPQLSHGARAMLDRVRVENAASHGISISGGATTGAITATVRDSVSAGNGGTGIAAFESGSGTIAIMVHRSASVNNGFGIIASGAGATVRIGDSTVTGNGTGLLAQSSGVIVSYGTNKVNRNDTDGAPNSTILPK